MPAEVQLESAATAVIVADPPAGHPDYPTPDSFDVQLVITGNRQPIADAAIDLQRRDGLAWSCLADHTFAPVAAT
jgi:hypothetical protein